MEKKITDNYRGEGSGRSKDVKVGNLSIGLKRPLTLVSGPCVIEEYEVLLKIARFLKELTERLEIQYIFKASYDKANRTSIDSYRGPGLKDGLQMLAALKKELGIKVLSDVHSAAEVGPAAEVLDVIHIPAFLCRQTDLLLEAGRTGKPVNIKKGQFLAPWDMKNVALKVASTGNDRIVITDRGTMFGYNNLVSDFRGIKIIQDLGYPVIFDVTHSVQLPGGRGNSSGGQREFAAVLARAAAAAGADGIFIEVHPEPEKALCDGPNSLTLDSLEPLLTQLKGIRNMVVDYDG
jgi:2-dehydro-3-deoxyphosphooctonate aldolase (KDO 8-P synthase)